MPSALASTNSTLSIAVLVVDPDPVSRTHTVDVLTRAGFTVMATNGFEPARQLIADKRPLILVTALKLGKYNGLHLVLRARIAAPYTAALVTSADPTIDMTREIWEAGATHVPQPVADQDLVACALRALFRSSPSERVVPPFERRAAERRKQEVDVPERRLSERRRTFESLTQAIHFN
jgi:DNA-binding response OmpR family regulator